MPDPHARSTVPHKKLDGRLGLSDEEARARSEPEPEATPAAWGPEHEDYAEAVRALTSLGY